MSHILNQRNRFLNILRQNLKNSRQIKFLKKIRTIIVIVINFLKKRYYQDRKKNSRQKKNFKTEKKYKTENKRKKLDIIQ